MTSDKRSAVSYLSGAAQFMLLILALGGFLALMTRSHEPVESGHLIYTDIGVFSYNWQAQTPERLAKVGDASGAEYWKVDQERVLGESCFGSNGFGCGFLVTHVFSANQPHDLDALKSEWWRDDGHLLWSPDNRLILFGLYLGQYLQQNDFHIMNSDGKQSRDLFPGDSSDGSHVIWSPDSQHLAYAGNNHQDLDIVDIRNSSVQRIADLNLDIADLAWSPDGRQFAFAVAVDLGRYQENIYTINSDGTNLRKISSVTAPSTGLAWSPDSSQFAFTTQDGIFAVKRDGTNLHQITNLKSASDLVWSPDSRHLAFMGGAKLGSYGSGTGYLYVADTNGYGVPTLLTQIVTLYAFDAPFPVLLWLN